MGLRFGFIIGIILLIAGCAGSSSQSNVAPQPEETAQSQPVGFNGIPGIPADLPEDALYREVSDVVPRTRNVGVSSPYSSWRTWVIPQDPGQDHLGFAGATEWEVNSGYGVEPLFAWAIYKVPNIERPDLNRVLKTLVLGSSSYDYHDVFWLGIANFDLNAWQWYGPGNAIPEYNLDLTSLAYDFTSEMGNMYFVIVVMPENLIHLQMAKVLVEDGETPPVGAPVAVLEADPPEGNAPLTVAFDAGGSHDPDGGSIVDYEWDFDGDGIFNENGVEEDNRGIAAPPPQVYPIGTWTPAVRVTDDEGDTAIASVTVVAHATPPVAILEADPAGGFEPLDVSLDASASFDADGGAIIDYEWDFDGDGIFNETGAEEDNRGVAEPPLQTYMIGTWNPGVRVTDNEGDTAVASVEITVSDPGLPPVAVLFANPERIILPGMSTVDFDATDSYDSDGSIVDYEWDLNGNGIFNEWGEEETSQGDDTASWSYSSSDDGINYASVRVTDNNGLTDTATVEIRVTSWF